jgi:hypothetical protein
MGCLFIAVVNDIDFQYTALGGCHVDCISGILKDLRTIQKRVSSAPAQGGVEEPIGKREVSLGPVAESTH